MLYDRDFKILTEQEAARLQKANDYRGKNKKTGITFYDPKKYHSMMPLAGYYYESLFPNNYLHIGELSDHAKLNHISVQFQDLLNSDPSERAVLNFINANRYYVLIGTILKSSYFFGHHGAYVFKEFELPPNFVVDYLLVGKNSGGYEFVFVELESPKGSIVNAGGDLGITIRKGLNQIEDWDRWIDSNFSHLRLMFQKFLGTENPLPNEFISLDKTRIHYAVVAGRRSDYKEKTYRSRRNLKTKSNITLLHYDNLIDTLQLFKTSGYHY